MQVPRQLHAGLRISNENGDGALRYAVDGNITVGDSSGYAHWRRKIRLARCVYVGDAQSGHRFHRPALVQIATNRKIGDHGYQETVFGIFWRVSEWSLGRTKGFDDFL